MARAVANEVEARFYYINGPDIIGTYAGETEGNLRRIFGEAGHHAPSIIFIDELDAIAPKRGETGAHADIRAVTQLLSLMDGLTRVDSVIVIGTTNRLDAVDPAFRRPGRFDREIFVGPPDAAGRRDVLEIHTREMPLARRRAGGARRRRVAHARLRRRRPDGAVPRGRSLGAAPQHLDAGRSPRRVPPAHRPNRGRARRFRTRARARSAVGAARDPDSACPTSPGPTSAVWTSCAKSCANWSRCRCSAPTCWRP